MIVIVSRFINQGIVRVRQASFACWFLVLSPYLRRAGRQQAFVGQTDEVAHLFVVAHVYLLSYFLYSPHDCLFNLCNRSISAAISAPAFASSCILLSPSISLAGLKSS